MAHKKITKLVAHVEPVQDTFTVNLTPKLAKKCMYCTLDISGQTIGCPTHPIVEYKDIKHNEKNSSNEYMTYGVFCSFNCAKAYAQSKENEQLFSQSCRYIEIIARREQGEPMTIIPSPPKELLRVYGGYMTEEQYRAELGKIQYIPNGTTITHPLTLVYIRK